GEEGTVEVEKRLKNDRTHAFFKINSIHIIQETALFPEYEFLKPGNILINIQNQKLIAIVDRETKKIVWSLKTKSSNHSAKLSPEGNIVYFANKNGKKITSGLRKFLALSMY